MWLMVISLQLCEATRIATWRRSKRTDSRRTGAAVIPFGGFLPSTAGWLTCCGLHFDPQIVFGRSSGRLPVLNPVDFI